MTQISNPATQGQATTPEVQAVDMSPSERLQAMCVGVRLNFSWFTTSRSVDARDKLQMAESIDSTPDGFSASKRLMSSKHPTIKMASELRRQIESIWRSRTLAMAGDINNGGVRAGVRMVHVDKYPELARELNAMRPRLEDMQQKLNDSYDDIKLLDKKRLGAAYNENDYPKKIEIDYSFGVIPIEIPKVLEKLAPEVYASELNKVKTSLAASAVVGVETLLNSLLERLEGLGNALTNVMRIYPAVASPYANYHGAEVMECRASQKDGRTVHAVDLRVRRGETFVPVTLENLSDEELAGLQISQVANERRKFKNSTVEHVTDFLAEFGKVASTLEICDSSVASRVREMVQQVERCVAACGNTDELCDRLRMTSGEAFRNRVQVVVTDVARQAREQLATVGETRRRLMLVKPLDA